MAVEIPISVPSKRVPWVETLAVEGADYSAATFAMEIRNKPGDTGTALVALANATAGTQGISCTYNPAYVDPETGEAFAASVITFQINEATMEGLPTASPTDASIDAHYDLQITPSGGVKFLLCYGAFTYAPGVTL